MPAGISYFRGVDGRLVWHKWRVRAINGTGSDRVEGDFMRFNSLFTDGAGVAPAVDPTQFDNRMGVPSGIWGTTAKHVATSIDHENAILGCFCAEDIRAGAEGWVYVGGIVTVTVNGTGDGTPGNEDLLDPGVPLASLFNYGDGTDGEALGSVLHTGVQNKCIAILMQQYVDVDGANKPALALVSPIFGFGSVG